MAETRKKTGIPTSRSIRKVREKIQESIEKESALFYDAALDLSKMATSGEIAGDPRTDPVKLLVGGACYELEDDNIKGVYIFERVIRAQTLLFLFRNVITGSATTFKTVDIRDLRKCRFMKDGEVEEYQRSYFASRIGLAMLGVKHKKA